MRSVACSSRLDFSRQISFQQSRTQRFKNIIFAILYSALPLKVHQHRTLLCLLSFMATHFDQGNNHMIEGVVIVVVEDNLPTFSRLDLQVRLNLSFNQLIRGIKTQRVH